jgi:glycosyltransferase involved in cell wall biosynthesis
LQSRRTRILFSYAAIVTASEHMRSEYLKHGFAPNQVKVIPLPGPAPASETEIMGQPIDGADLNLSDAARLLFVGRMDFVKGGGVLLDALPSVLKTTGQPLEVTFVGDGPERGRWERKASHLQSREPRLRTHFTGWLEQREVKVLFRRSDLLVIPSLWPEPFGLIGLEAGSQGLPTAAFDVGGISDWLTDGVNGHLAGGDPPTPAGLAQAIVKCLPEAGRLGLLRRNAAVLSMRFRADRHITELLSLFSQLLADSDLGQCREHAG